MERIDMLGVVNQCGTRLGRRGFLGRLASGVALGAGGLVATRRGVGAQDAPCIPLPDEVASAITHRQVETNGISMHIAEAGTCPLVVLVHGWPEQAVLVGHDIGAGITWACAELHPERIAAHVTLGIAYGPRPPAPPVEQSREFTADAFAFLDYVQQPGIAEAELEADARRSLCLIMYALSGDARPDLLMYLFTGKPGDAGFLDGMPEPEPLPSWLSEADLDVYTSAYVRTGFRGSFGFYRNFDSDWEDLPEVGATGVNQPALFIGGRHDPAVVFTGYEAFDAMEAAVPNLRKIVLLPGAGHWVQQERPDVVNFELINFIRYDSGI